MNNIFLSGTSSNPYHFSVAAVIVNSGKVVYINKRDGTHTLPRETISTNESLQDGLRRGCIEELGIDIQIKRFIGSLKIFFTREDNENIQIEKTTLYFEVEVIGKLEKNLEDDEYGDRVLISEISDVIKLFKEEGNSEYEILERLHD